jgi:hypothetical protein
MHRILLQKRPAETGGFMQGKTVSEKEIGKQLLLEQPLMQKHPYAGESAAAYFGESLTNRIVNIVTIV